MPAFGSCIGNKKLTYYEKDYIFCVCSCSNVAGFMWQFQIWHK